MGYVITSENDHELRRVKFGLTPHWSKEPMDILSARAEGDKNLNNDPYYNGPNSVFLKPAFKKAIQHYRCLVIADGFTDISTKKSQLITYLKTIFPLCLQDYIIIGKILKLELFNQDLKSLRQLQMESSNK